MNVIRLFVLVMVGIGVLWIPIVRGGSELFHYIQTVQSLLAPPLAAVYVLAILYPRANEAGAFWGMMIGIPLTISN